MKSYISILLLLGLLGGQSHADSSSAENINEYETALIRKLATEKIRVSYDDTARQIMRNFAIAEIKRDLRRGQRAFISDSPTFHTWSSRWSEYK